jgi:hypothetical protein
MSDLNKLFGRLSKVKRRKKTGKRIYNSEAIAVKLKQVEQNQDQDIKEEQQAEETT